MNLFFINTNMTDYKQIHDRQEQLRTLALAGKNVGNKGLLIGFIPIIEFINNIEDWGAPHDGITITVPRFRPDMKWVTHICSRITNIHNNIMYIINPKNSLLPTCIFNNWVIAGGAIVSYLIRCGTMNPVWTEDCPNMDIDFFPKSITFESDLKEIKEYFSNRHHTTVIETSYSMTIYQKHRYPLQFIKASFIGGSIGNLLYPFDLSIAGFAIDFETKLPYATPEALFELVHRTIYMYHSRLSSNYETRALKYLLIKKIDLCIPGVNPQFIDGKISNGINQILNTVNDVNKKIPVDMTTINETSMYLDNSSNDPLLKFLNILDPNKQWHSRLPLSSHIVRFIENKLINQSMYGDNKLKVDSMNIIIDGGEISISPSPDEIKVPWYIRQTVVAIKLNRLMNAIESNNMTDELLRFCDRYKINPIQILKHSWDGTMNGVMDEMKYTIDLQQRVINNAKYRYYSWWCLKDINPDTFGNILPAELCAIIVDYSADEHVIVCDI
jgi:hypothetical protein